MTTPTVLKTMSAWQFTGTKGGIDKALHINPLANLPTPKPNQHLIRILACALNPVDYKVAELPLVGSLIVPKNATPGLDCSGIIVTASPSSGLKAGDIVFGAAGTGSVIAGGACAEYALVKADMAAQVPEGVDPIEAATIGVAGLTAYQSIVTRVKKGDRVFINGGSGGTGCFGIQMAKAVGCHVTTTCSARNIELCKSLGADEVIDYTSTDVVSALCAGEIFDHAVDNIGKDFQLCLKCHEFLKPGAVIVVVGGDPSLSGLKDMLRKKLVPGFLGGVKGKVDGFWPVPNLKDLNQIAEWIKEGKVKAVIDTRFPYEEANKAFEKLKTGRARGKIVVLGLVEQGKA